MYFHFYYKVAGLGDEFYPAPNQWRRDSIALPAAYLNKENETVYQNGTRAANVGNIPCYNL